MAKYFTAWFRQRLTLHSPPKNKICSLRLTDELVRATFLNHYALNNDGQSGTDRANHSRFPFTNHAGARADA
jgi:hypothetical protein